MAKFKVGDKVIRIGPDFYGIKQYNTYTVRKTFCGGIFLAGFDRPCDPDMFIAYPDTTAAYPEAFPSLDTILLMDRVLAKAGVPSTTLNKYLDKPLSQFITEIMEPKKIGLIDNRSTSY